MLTNQKGFSVFEVLVVIVMLGLIGAVGWLVYDRQKSDDSEENKKTSQVVEKEQKSGTVNDEVKRSKYFEIKEFGVKFELPDNLSGLYYSMGNNNRTAYFSLNELKSTDCAADKTAQISLSRYNDADFEDDFMASRDRATKMGEYYFTVTGGQAACSEDQAIQGKATQLKSDIAQLLPGALTAL